MNHAMRAMAVLAGCLVLLSNAWAQDWPQWRGPGRDNKVTGFTAPKTWPKELTKKWKVPVGEGVSSPVLAGDRLYVFGRQGGDEITRCLDAGSGKELWVDMYAAVAVKFPAQRFPGPRSTPAVGAGKVCTLGVGGVVSCLDAASGAVVWRKDTGGKPQFYTSTSPIIADGKCIVYVDALTAYDLATGKPAWRWKGNGPPYGSPILMTVDGVKQVVTPMLGGLAGVALADGKPLWQVKVGAGGKDYQSNFSTPLAAGAIVYYSATAKGGKGGKGGAAGSGTLALKIEKKDDGFVATELWRKPLSAHQYHTPLLKDGLIFGVNPRLNFYCMDAKTGAQRWIDEGTKQGQCGAILDVGPVLLALSSNNELIVLRPADKEFSEVARYRVGGDSEAWAVPIVAGNRVFVRDREALTLWTIE